MPLRSDDGDIGNTRASHARSTSDNRGLRRSTTITSIGRPCWSSPIRSSIRGARSTTGAIMLVSHGQLTTRRQIGGDHSSKCKRRHTSTMPAARSTRFGKKKRSVSLTTPCMRRARRRRAANADSVSPGYRAGEGQRQRPKMACGISRHRHVAKQPHKNELYGLPTTWSPSRHGSLPS